MGENWKPPKIRENRNCGKFAQQNLKWLPNSWPAYRKYLEMKKSFGIQHFLNFVAQWRAPGSSALVTIYYTHTPVHQSSTSHRNLNIKTTISLFSLNILGRQWIHCKEGYFCFIFWFINLDIFKFETKILHNQIDTILNRNFLKRVLKIGLML